MDWERNINTKNCEFCGLPYKTTNVRTRGRLCPTCTNDKREIDTVRGMTPYTQMTQQQKSRALQRIMQKGKKPNKY